MTGWLLRITKMVSEVLFEKLVRKIAWPWPKKLVSVVISKRTAAEQPQVPMIEEKEAPPSSEGANLVAPASMGPQHDASNYRLRLIGGAYVYEFHARPDEGHDSCWACQKCFDDGKVSLLQPDFPSVEFHGHSVEWTCSQCGRCYLIYRKERPPNW